MNLRNIFVCGPPRSGTTVLAELLNNDDRILVGIERYKFIPSSIVPKHFNEEVFFAPKKEETDFLNYDRYYRKLHDKLETGTLVYIGDKVPRYAYTLPYICNTFPECKIIYLFRNLYDVASSFDVRAENPNDHWPKENDFKQALNHWHRGLQGLSEFSEKFPSNQIYVLDYEKFFSGEETQLNSLYEFLELEVTKSIYDSFVEVTKGWEERKKTSLGLSHEKRTWLERHINREFEELGTTLATHTS